MDKSVIRTVIADNKVEVPKYKVIEVIPIWKWLLNW
jgi:predicted AAA+ superfamily ATPase